MISGPWMSATVWACAGYCTTSLLMSVLPGFTRTPTMNGLFQFDDVNVTVGGSFGSPGVPRREAAGAVVDAAT